jgi:hypothetical protein
MGFLACGGEILTGCEEKREQNTCLQNKTTPAGFGNRRVVQSVPPLKCQQSLTVSDFRLIGGEWESRIPSPEKLLSVEQHTGAYRIATAIGGTGNWIREHYQFWVHPLEWSGRTNFH